MSDSNLLHTHRLENGLQIVGQLMPDFETVALSYHVRTGARDEADPAIFGVSHFLEHMIFKGTKTLGWQQLKEEFTKIGAGKNGITSVERTLYYLYVLSEYLDRAFELLSEMVMEPRLDESDFEQEKGVIVNEIARSEEQPHGFLHRRMMHAYFDGHPLGNYVLGSRESIHGMHLTQMRDYWQRRYVANNMVLSVAGNFDWEHLVELAEQTCCAWPSGGAERVVGPYEPSAATRTVLVDEHLKQQIVTISMPMLDRKDPDYYAGSLASTILGDTDGSRLYWNIRQKGLAQSAASTIWTLDGTGIMFLEASTTPEKAPYVLKLLRTELEHVLSDGIEEAELRRAKEKHISEIAFGSESTYNRMRTLASDWMYKGRLYSVDEQIARIEQVTREDVMRTLRRYPLMEKQVFTTLGPLGEEQWRT